MQRSLRTWLKVEPHPVRIRMTDAEGEERVVRIGESKSRWRDAENALKGAVKCVALNEAGEILRDWTDDEALVTSQTAAQVDGARTELSELARIITESNDAAVGRLVEILQVNLAQNAQLVNVLSERNRQLEHAWQRLFTQSVQAQTNEPSLPADPNLALIGQIIGAAAPSLLAGLVGGAAPSQPPPQHPPPKNGAHK